MSQLKIAKIHKGYKRLTIYRGHPDGTYLGKAAHDIDEIACVTHVQKYDAVKALLQSEGLTVHHYDPKK